MAKTILHSFFEKHVVCVYVSPNACKQGWTSWMVLPAITQ